MTWNEENGNTDTAAPQAGSVWDHVTLVACQAPSTILQCYVKLAQHIYLLTFFMSKI